jgi:hypothetical protein
LPDSITRVDQRQLAQLESWFILVVMVWPSPLTAIILL